MGFAWQWHQLNLMHTICTSLQTDNQSIFTGRMLFLMPNQQCQSTEGNHKHIILNNNYYNKNKKTLHWKFSRVSLSCNMYTVYDPYLHNFIIA